MQSFSDNIHYVYIIIQNRLFVLTKSKTDCVKCQVKRKIRGTVSIAIISINIMQ